MKKFETKTALLFSSGPAIGYNVVHITRIFWENANYGNDLVDDPEYATGSFDDGDISPVEEHLKDQYWVAFGDRTQPSVEMIATTPRNTKRSHRNKSISIPSSEQSLFDDK